MAKPWTASQIRRKGLPSIPIPEVAGFKFRPLAGCESKKAASIAYEVLDLSRSSFLGTQYIGMALQDKATGEWAKSWNGTFDRKNYPEKFRFTSAADVARVLAAEAVELDRRQAERLAQAKSEAEQQRTNSKG